MYERQLAIDVERRMGVLVRPLRVALHTDAAHHLPSPSHPARRPVSTHTSTDPPHAAACRTATLTAAHTAATLTTASRAVPTRFPAAALALLQMLAARPPANVAAAVAGAAAAITLGVCPPRIRWRWRRPRLQETRPGHRGPCWVRRRCLRRQHLRR